MANVNRSSATTRPSRVEAGRGRNWRRLTGIEPGQKCYVLHDISLQYPSRTHYAPLSLCVCVCIERQKPNPLMSRHKYFILLLDLKQGLHLPSSPPTPTPSATAATASKNVWHKLSDAGFSYIVPYYIICSSLDRAESGRGGLG